MSPEIFFGLISPNHEFKAQITGSADDETVTAVMELAGISVAWREGDGTLYFSIMHGFEWAGVRPEVIAAIKRAKRWNDAVGRGH